MTAAGDKREALKRWLRARLGDDARTRAEWRELWASSWEHMLETPADALIDARALRVLADRLADPELVSELLRPLVAGLATQMIAELRRVEQPVDRLLPAEAQERLKAVVARPGRVDPDLVRATLRGEAVEGVVSDALYRALKDFSVLLPRMFVKLSPMGRFGLLGGASALAERLVEEVEKLVEPEIRSFLADSSGRVLERAAEETVERLDDPASIELRVSIARFMLSRSPALHLEAVDEALMADIGSIAEQTARHAATLPETKVQLEAWIDRLLAASAGRSLGELLALAGRDFRPPVDAIADATWPVFVALLEGPAAQRWLDRMVDDLLDAYEQMD